MALSDITSGIDTAFEKGRIEGFVEGCDEVLELLDKG